MFLKNLTCVFSPTDRFEEKYQWQKHTTIPPTVHQSGRKVQFKSIAAMTRQDSTLHTHACPSPSQHTHAHVHSFARTWWGEGRATGSITCKSQLGTQRFQFLGEAKSQAHLQVIQQGTKRSQLEKHHQPLVLTDAVHAQDAGMGQLNHNSGFFQEVKTRWRLNENLQGKKFIKKKLSRFSSVNINVHEWSHKRTFEERNCALLIMATKLIFTTGSGIMTGHHRCRMKLIYESLYSFSRRRQPSIPSNPNISLMSSFRFLSLIKFWYPTINRNIIFSTLDSRLISSFNAQPYSIVFLMHAWYKAPSSSTIILSHITFETASWISSSKPISYLSPTHPFHHLWTAPK